MSKGSNRRPTFQTEAEVTKRWGETFPKLCRWCKQESANLSGFCSHDCRIDYRDHFTDRYCEKDGE